MQRLSSILPGDLDLDGVCRRTTGRTLAEWDAEWLRRRANGILSRRISRANLLTPEQRDSEIRYYDLTEDDFEPVAAKTIDQPIALYGEYRDMDVVVLDSRDAEEHIARHEANAQVSCPPLKAMVLYRITQSAIRRIQNEPRPKQAA